MSRVLVTYATNAGSTTEVAEAAAEALAANGHEVDSHPISEVESLEPYDSVVVGAPMILGWHTRARRFVRRNRKSLSSKKVAYFACAMTLTQDMEECSADVPLVLDPNLVSDFVKDGSLNIKERFTSLSHYLKPMLGAAPDIGPASVAFFHGKLDMTRLKWWQALFVMVVVQAVPGDYRDWDAIRTWAGSLSAQL